jgi:hypothetical protein
MTQGEMRPDAQRAFQSISPKNGERHTHLERALLELDLTKPRWIFAMVPLVWYRLDLRVGVPLWQ